MRKRAASPNQKKFWLLVGLAMAVVVALWAWWLYPQSTARSSRNNQRAYADFKNRLNEALSLFKKNSRPDGNDGKISDEVQELRQRVFGDSTKK